MSGINQKLAAIPVTVDGGSQPQFHWKRRLVQALIIVLIVLIPASGLFRIDPEAGAFVVFDRQVWFSDFFLMAGLWIFLLSCLVMLYSVAGTVICGWACPQNTLAEWSNNLTRKLLGKRAEVKLEGDGQVAAAKNRALNWVVLIGAFTLVSLFFALIPLFYFYPPDLVWAFIVWKDDTRLAGSLHWIYAVCALIIFLDISMIRHFWCRFSCIYRVWQHSFKTRQTLHVRYDASRAGECEKCNYCKTVCFIDLDPRKTDVYDSCINCGECIDACNGLHAREHQPGLLSFELGSREKANSLGTAAINLFSRAGWMAPFALGGALLFAWGLWTYQPYHVAVGRAEAQADPAVQDYRIAISNKLYHPAQMHVTVEGLRQGQYRLSSENIRLLPAGHESVTLSVTRDMPHGLHSFVVEASASDGWAGRFNIQHFAQ